MLLTEYGHDYYRKTATIPGNERTLNCLLITLLRANFRQHGPPDKLNETRVLILINRCALAVRTKVITGEANSQTEYFVRTALQLAPEAEAFSQLNLQERLEETHREKVTRVMKDWSDLEERYQDMRASDPRGADAFKQRMTQRFQQTVQALEEEGDAEKHQLAAMHQQRVLAHINQRKKEAMTCYTQALNDQPPNVSINNLS